MESEFGKGLAHARDREEFSPLSAYLIYCSAWPLLNLIVFTIVVRFKNRGCFMYFGLF